MVRESGIVHVFLEDDVFDNEFSRKDFSPLIIKGSFGEEMTLVRDRCMLK